jgi:hypothetical protein
VLPGCKSAPLSHSVEKVARRQIFEAQTAASLRPQKLVLCLSQVVGNTCPQYPLSRDGATATALHGRPADRLARQLQSKSDPEGSEDLCPIPAGPVQAFHLFLAVYPSLCTIESYVWYHRIICKYEVIGAS